MNLHQFLSGLNYSCQKEATSFFLFSFSGLLVSAIHPNLCPSVYLLFLSMPLFSPCGCLTLLLPSTWWWRHPWAPQPTPTVGQRSHEQERTEKKNPTIASRAGSLSFTEVSQNKSGGHYARDLGMLHHKTTSRHVQTDSAP